jgi:hypothetical protein
MQENPEIQKPLVTKNNLLFIYLYGVLAATRKVNMHLFTVIKMKS